MRNPAPAAVWAPPSWSVTARPPAPHSPAGSAPIPAPCAGRRSFRSFPRAAHARKHRLATLAALAPDETQIETAARCQRISRHTHIPVAGFVTVFGGVEGITEGGACRYRHTAPLPLLLPLGLELQRFFARRRDDAPVGETEFHGSRNRFVAKPRLEAAGAGRQQLHRFRVESARQVKSAPLVRQQLRQPQAHALTAILP